MEVNLSWFHKLFKTGTAKIVCHDRKQRAEVLGVLQDLGYKLGENVTYRFLDPDYAYKYNEYLCPIYEKSFNRISTVLPGFGSEISIEYDEFMNIVGGTVVPAPDIDQLF